MLAQLKTPLTPPTTSLAPTLRRWYMIVNGNQHRPDLCAAQPGFTKPFMLSEALIPQVRTVACLIAAERLAFDAPTPEHITTEADWFAARILVLGVKVFHLDVTLIPMMKSANQRAQAFARKHGLPFTPAQMRMSLHAGRPQQMLVMETDDSGHNDIGLVGNSLALRRQIATRHHLLQA
ncbi:hypothetical protein JQU52_12860 [Paralysiella testudinis]|uniref:Uncharacterized protein n=2 Tax=Paralysiella testudinis TaxID=2809020 RepID=A0A892ZJH6_9NEIS|nr:hypothetical protein JQU52_12860 [Paralysiella testudinis]